MNKKKFLVLLLALVMVFTAVPVSAIELEPENGLGDGYTVSSDYEYDSSESNYGYEAYEDSKYDYDYAEEDEAYDVVPMNEIVAFDSTQHTATNLADVRAFLPSGANNHLVNDGDSILLDAQITIPAGQTLDLDFNGDEITFLVSGDFFHFIVNGEMTMADGVTLQGHRPSGITLGNSVPVWPNGGGVRVQAATGHFTMHGGVIYGNRRADGAGVRVDNGTFIMTGGTITGNAATNLGAGVAIWQPTGSFTMSGDAKISENFARSAGGVRMTNGTFTMDGGLIEGNRATDASAGVGMGNGVFTMNAGARITGNEIPFGGGGIRHGGGVGVEYDAVFVMNGGVISGNTAPVAGGVSVTGRFVMNDGEVINNISWHEDRSDNIALITDRGSVGTFESEGGTVNGDIEVNLGNVHFRESNRVTLPADRWSDTDVNISADGNIEVTYNGDLVVKAPPGFNITVGEDTVRVELLGQGDHPPTDIEAPTPAIVSRDPDTGEITITLPNDEGNDTTIIFEPGENIDVSRDPDTGEIILIITDDEGNENTITFQPGETPNLGRDPETGNLNVTITDENGNVVREDSLSPGDNLDTRIMWGDLTGTGAVTMADLGMLRQYLAGLITADQIPNYAAAAVSGNANVGMADLMLMRQYLADVISTFPAAR